MNFGKTKQGLRKATRSRPRRATDMARGLVFFIIINLIIIYIIIIITILIIVIIIIY